MNLEEIEPDILPQTSKERKNILRRTWDIIRSPQYKADVLSGWIYYTATYGPQEAILGKEWDSLMLTRLFGLGMHAALMRPIGKLRDYFAKKRGVTKESSLIDKLKVNLTAITPIQSPVYAGMLAGGMYISGKWDLEASFYNWMLGTGLSALHAFPAGWLQDRVRRFYGIAPAIK